MSLDLHKLFTDVFHPEPDESIVVLTDVPDDSAADSKLWSERMAMAEEWQKALVSLGEQVGFSVLPLITYPAVGAHNGDLPLSAGDPLRLDEALSRVTLAVALTQYSATAPLSAWAMKHDDFRAASLPEVARRMEATALAADYVEVARRCQILRDELTAADLAKVRFATGHEWSVDLRYRDGQMDDGQLPRDKSGFRIINLPSGESFQVPYEGEREGDPSRTEGEIPIPGAGDDAVLRVEENRIVEVVGDGSKAERLRTMFEVDPARRNIAELALGCNPNAVVWGNVLEDEKAGFHWAYGRSEHLGGTVGPSSFLSTDTIVHQDIVYAKDSPIGIASLVLVSKAGDAQEIIQDGQYLIGG